MKKNWKWLFAIILILFSAETKAQLPPTIFRISEVDSAVDVFLNNQDNVQMSSVNESFQEAFVAKNRSFIINGSPILNERPFSVEIWAKFDSASNYNILLAHEEKSSPRHWELYTMASSGHLALYLPGNSAIENIQGSASIVDGNWHYIGLVMNSDYAELFVDGKSVAQGTINRNDVPTPDNTKFAIGSLVEGALFCDGAIDELRIQQGILSFDVDRIPVSPLDANSQTILLAHFDWDDSNRSASGNEEQEKEKAADSALSLEKTAETTNLSNAEISQSKLKSSKSSCSESFNVDRFASVPKTFRASTDSTKPGDLLSFDELEIEKIKLVSFPIQGLLADKNNGIITLDSGLLDRLFPTGAPEIAVQPGEKPARNIPIQKISREAFEKRVAELGIESLKFDDFRSGVWENWGEQFVYLRQQLDGQMPLPKGAADQVYDSNALVFPETESQPVQVILRRTNALMEYFDAEGIGYDESAVLRDFFKLSQNIDPANAEQSTVDYFIASAIRRKIMFSNSELSDLDRIMFLARACYAGCRLTNMSNTDRMGGHFATQIYGFNTIAGGGLFAISDWKAQNPKIDDLIQGKKVKGTDVCSRLDGRELNYGSFMSPDLSFDGKTIYFAHCGSKEHRWLWTPDTTWNLFKMSLEDGSIEQLTDSAYNDFDICELPSGRLVFCSERRGGFIRCFGEDAALRVTTSVLHSMKNDGSDIYPISFFETSEWQPSVDNNGMLVYTRWDYTDRENCLGSTYWTCFPDGRNPRSPQGNYPFPWFTFEDNTHGDHRFGTCPDAPSGLPMTQMQYRAIPDSHKYIFTAAPHHGETFGSLCILDLRVENDNHMSQIRRITPFVPFPESEMAARSQYRYGAPWPINEDLYLCNSWENLVLLDRFGNEELICEREILPIGYDPRLRLSEPIPLKPRVKPAVIAQQTTQGEDFSDRDQKATIGVINVNIADLPFPENRPIKYLRVLQVIPKPNPWMDTPWIGYATENTPRIPLGIVPVEEDGSVYFEAPFGKQLIFQVLDQDYKAIQTMRAVAFVHPGEKLVCTGCHEPNNQSVQNENSLPIAFQRPAAKLTPECGPVEPINFYRMIQPIFENRCVECHQKEQKGPQKMGYDDMHPFVYYYSGSMSGGTLHTGTHGGSRSCPGRVGASEAKLGSILFDDNHKDSVSDEDRHKIILWLDANALRLGAFQDEKAQKEGTLVWPLLDTEPCDLYDPQKMP
ncbi:MAG: LamG-like jellyroll fold domain-containing protein [Planctomycetia bacterium]|nr:LamG-like jellyroll fold domain-containing protein [Planctomycetia bacterium]